MCGFLSLFLCLMEEGVEHIEKILQNFGWKKTLKEKSTWET
jgi:hypothetical protein